MARISPNPKARTTLLPVPVNRDEKLAIGVRAAAARMKPTVFVREMALAGKIITVPAVNDEDRLELRRQGHNLNQLVHAIHAGGNPDAHATLADLRGLLHRIDQRLSR